jgi:uncharacterized phage protein (TIGR01671 family)
MERIIKFRAWDDGKMVYQTGALVSLKRFIRVIREDALLLQFSERFDSKGVEIYEKDIVLVENSLPEEKGEFDVTTICKWDNGFILEDNCGGHWTRQLLHEPERLTVIGNVFTHPELIK